MKRSVPEHVDVHLVVDNVSTHKTPEIHRWRCATPVPPPLHAHLQLMDELGGALVAELTTKWLRRGTVRPRSCSSRPSRPWIDRWNEEPKPFVWHKSADEILDTLAGHYERISDSGD